MKSKAIVFTDVHQVSVIDVEIPEPKAGEILIEAAYTLISPGTELRCLAGKQVGAVFPFVAGYALMGQVIACGPNTTLKIGAWVYCSGTKQVSLNRSWGGHIQYAVQDEQKVLPVPAGVLPLNGVIAQLAGIAYRGVRLSEAKPNETVAVIGLGAIGQCSARLYATTGAKVVAADLSPHRVKVAQEAGIEAFVPKGDLAEAFREFLPNGADVVVDATGATSVLPGSIAVARAKSWDDPSTQNARLIIQGSYPDDFWVPYKAAFDKELTLRIPRNVHQDDLQTVLDLIADKRLNPKGIVSAVRTPEEAPQTYAELADRDSPLITVAFQWRELAP